LLIEFCRFLERQVAFGDSVVRLGGDEFALLIGGADEARLESVVTRLREAADSAPCAFSLGSAVREDGETLSATLSRADGRMYSVRAAARTGAPA